MSEVYSEGRWKLAKMDGTRNYAGGDLEVADPTEADFRSAATMRMETLVLSGTLGVGTRVKLTCHVGGGIRTVVVSAELPAPEVFMRALAELSARAEDLAGESERGASFLEDVAAQADDMAEWVDDNGRVTDEQLRAYLNWSRGVDAWDR